EHAALAPKYLGQVAVIAQSYARIAWQNLVNFGILPLEFINNEDYDHIEQGDMVLIKDLPEDIKDRKNIQVVVQKENGDTVEFETKHTLSDRQIDVLLKGGIINEFKEKLDQKDLKA
ncbi:MAG: aconitate hydratase, partial [Flavobacteriaceae bacterium]|nr:aconitate hydratase [Flavobacteriaceae bacterium]